MSRSTSSEPRNEAAIDADRPDARRVAGAGASVPPGTPGTQADAAAEAAGRVGAAGARAPAPGGRADKAAAASDRAAASAAETGRTAPGRSVRGHQARHDPRGGQDSRRSAEAQAPAH